MVTYSEKMDINTAISVTSHISIRYKFVINPFQAGLKLNMPFQVHLLEFILYICAIFNIVNLSLIIHEKIFTNLYGGFVVLCCGGWAK